MRLKTNTRRLVLVLAAASILGLAACGEDDSGPSGAGGAATTAAGPGNGSDLAFVTEMIPHHEGAVEMAKIALERGESDFVKELATTIDRTQTEEIATLRRLKSDLEALGVRVEPLAHEMDMEMGAAGLRDADPFDRAFVDMMIPHHQDAIRMAREVLDKGENAQVRELAEAIIDAQATEIDDMNGFRQDTYGAASPAGGVPETGAVESPAPEDGGGHGGM